MVKTSFFIALFLLSFISLGQNAFLTSYSYLGNDQGRTILEHSDTSYVVCAYSNSGDAGKNRLVFIEIDSLDGAVLQTYIHDSQKDLKLADAIKYGDSTIVLVKETGPNNISNNSILIFDSIFRLQSTIRSQSDSTAFGLQLSNIENGIVSGVFRGYNDTTGLEESHVEVFNIDLMTSLNTYFFSDATHGVGLNDIKIIDSKLFVSGNENYLDSTKAFMLSMSLNGSQINSWHPNSYMNSKVSKFSFSNDYIGVMLKFMKRDSSESITFYKIDTTLTEQIVYESNNLGNSDAIQTLIRPDGHFVNLINSRDFGMMDGYSDFLYVKLDGNLNWGPWSSTKGYNFDDNIYSGTVTKNGTVLVIGNSRYAGLGSNAIMVEKIGNNDEYVDISSLTKYELETLEIQEEAYSMEITIYPNPASHWVQITSSTEFDLVNFYSSNGELVLSTNGTSNAIDLQHLTPGIYLVQLISEGKTWNSKLIIE